MIYRDDLFISVTGVFLLTIFTSVNLILLICQNKHLIQSLLDGSDTAGIFTSDHVYNLLRKTKVFFLNDLLILNNIYGDIVINETKDIQIQIFNRSLNLDDVLFAHLIALCVLDDRNSTVKLVKLQVMINSHSLAGFDMV